MSTPSLYFFPYCFSNQMSSASLPKGFLIFFSFFFATPGPNSNFGTISTSFREEPLVKKPPGSTLNRIEQYFLNSSNHWSLAEMKSTPGLFYLLKLPEYFLKIYKCQIATNCRIFLMFTLNYTFTKQNNWVAFRRHPQQPKCKTHCEFVKIQSKPLISISLQRNF